ncbi:nucleotidyl transferase AbiEii/AbiGii toxin family protein [Roseiconus lacunae]|uniref:nucleotidyl transferase AbiEii/AbiGii toxin family protein n=1 Tax=Roseiconus lacunae TaxID=2605694 RepID=UPI0011F155B1|nr:nucleotidyl transferase AbiEii/AbiGii toxin family protein [Roseiconus lacunae]
MFPVEAFERTIGKFVAIAALIDLPFHLTGGSISSAYGEPRLTQDIDIVVSPEIVQCRVDDLVNLLGSSDFMFTESVIRQAVQGGGLFQLLDKSESLKLDIYARELIPGELQRSQTIELFEGVFLPVVSRTDAAISKLIWIDKGSQRSRRDFRGIFRACDEKQQSEIQNKATDMHLGKLLNEVLAESDEIR